MPGRRSSAPELIGPEQISSCLRPRPTRMYLAAPVVLWSSTATTSGGLMTNVTRIDWTIQTGDQWWSGTDTQVQMEIYRDGDLIKRLNLEPGNTPRLHRGELATYFWVFQDPDGL